MAFDSTIRLKQLNQSELSGFVIGLINTLTPNNTSGNIIPSGSGEYSLGSSIDYYENIYSNTLNLPSSGEINFGGTSFSAYVQNGAGIVDIGGYTISSNGTFISIQGPSGLRGFQGIIGPTGQTGISITGAFFSGASSGIIFQLSNGNNLPVVLLPTFTGASGVSVNSFTQSGNSIYPNFSNGRTGALINLPTGIQGPIGLPGTVILNYVSGGNPFTQVNFPNAPFINNYFTEATFPTLSFMRGMSYTITLSGLSTHFLTPLELSLITGIFSGIPNVGLSTTSETAYYSDPKNTTGYWRFAFFPTTVATGIYSGEYFSNPVVPAESTDITTAVDVYRSLTTFNVPYIAQNNYNYGFSLYGLGDTSIASGVYNTSATGFAIVCGNVIISSGVGPVGAQGIQGIPGIGIKGDPGPPGQNGYALPSVTGVNYQIVGPNQEEIQFLLINGGTTNWIPLPSGGPAGAPGEGGSLINSFQGDYNETATYVLNNIVTDNGSTYVYINSIPSVGNEPPNTSYWQLLAASGSIGTIGPSGLASIYSCNFNVVSGIPTGVGSYVFGITGITVTGGSLSGTNAIFTTGQSVSFINSGLVGLAYTPYQEILVSTNTYTGSYFYATVNSYNSSEGLLSFSVLNGLSNLTGILGTTIDSSHNILWYNYGNATVNLGANLMTGAQGIQGIQGIPGTGAPTLIQSGNIYVTTGGTVNLDPSKADCFNIIVSGDSPEYFGFPQANINFINFPTGKSIILKIRNSGVPVSLEPDIFVFNGVNIQWPNGVFSCPQNGQIYIYTILRFMDEPDTTMAVFGTYSNPYQYNNFN